MQSQEWSPLAERCARISGHERVPDEQLARGQVRRVSLQNLLGDGQREIR
jgi:hypothetical protein